jgi:hypothetical protein
MYTLYSFHSPNHIADFYQSDIETLIYTLSKKYNAFHLSVVQTLEVTSQLELVTCVMQLQKIPTNRSVFSFMMSEQKSLSSFQLCLRVHLNSKPKLYFAYTLHNIRSSNLYVFYLAVNRM